MSWFNSIIIRTMPLVPKPLVGKIASAYIAGETLEDAIKLANQLNSTGAVATLDLLGEDCKSESDALHAKKVYLSIIESISKNNIDSNVSLKPTHMGLKINYDLCFNNILEIVQRAKELNNFVRIDMEDHTCTDDTLKIYKTIRKDYENVGVVIQAYMRRTIKDIEALKEMKANLRLCKGIYNEPRKIAYKQRSVIIENFAFLLKELLSAGCYVGIATHCEETVWRAFRIIHDLKLNFNQYEFQMLLGVDPELREIIIEAGHKLRVYVPYGEEWYAYSTRRLKENPQIAGAVAMNFLGLAKHGR